MPPTEINVPELFVTLGRMEGKLDSLGSLDGRVRSLEGEMQVVKATTERDRARRAPWWVVVGVIFGALTAAGGAIALLVTLNKIADGLGAAGF